MCCFLIEGLEKPVLKSAFGVDALQALVIAIQGLRITLDESGHRLNGVAKHSRSWKRRLLSAKPGRIDGKMNWTPGNPEESALTATSDKRASRSRG